MRASKMTRVDSCKGTVLTVIALALGCGPTANREDYRDRDGGDFPSAVLKCEKYVAERVIYFTSHRQAAFDSCMTEQGFPRKDLSKLLGGHGIIPPDEP